MCFCKAALVLSYVGYFQTLDHTSYSYKCSLNVSAWVGYVLQSFIGNSKAMQGAHKACLFCAVPTSPLVNRDICNFMGPLDWKFTDLSHWSAAVMTPLRKM